MSNLTALINETADQLGTTDVDAITAAVLAGCPKKWAELVYPAVRQYVRVNIRQGQRSIEQRDHDENDDVPTMTLRGGRLDLLTATFACGPDLDFVRVTWGDATEAHHASRRMMLAEQMGGIQQTSDRHARAIGLLRKHHVGRLDDIKDRDYVIAVIRGEITNLPEAA